MSKQLDCNVHDYFEIICMRKSWVTVTTKAGENFIGEAHDIALNSAKQELLMLKNTRDIGILLTEVARLHAHDNAIAQHNFLVNIT
ncbi:hypothetical protein C1E23_17465 [Pseudoalteromonas phenolica]|uniref:Transcriptional antiterminator n=1 Tax=Pseudoalteromonas phenolica TaxID=161398 RepID=A0A4Q7ILG2_9GAMM|nr:Rho-binding antiterminator [Pseudoalteromonas phenolica]RZQ51777.1 hypothetical protein C1E23_17465 [Pseudoalteromonas phenolica]